MCTRIRHYIFPKQFFGHDVGDDYYLSNYKQLSEYWHFIDKESNRVTLEVIGKTAEGRDQLMAIVSSPSNLKNRERYRAIAQRLALAKGITKADAEKLAKDGKAVVWIDGGLHATETLGAQQLIQTLYQLASQDDQETKRILDNVIILMVHANPDGMDLVSDWYMANKNTSVPRLYQKYIGHDNNRDSYMVTQPETKNMSRIMYRTWYPQIMYNHHQAGPAGTVMFCPPFRDPVNHRVDPQVLSGIDLVGAAMMQRFIRNDMPGVTTGNGAPYSMWWNGGLRTTACFHNIIGILTETIGNPTPMRIPFVANRRVSQNNMKWPIEPQEWKFKSSVDYSVHANFAILDLAARYKEKFLFDIYTMGRRQIELGTKDTWTDTPSRATIAKSIEDLRKPELRNPRAYVLPHGQPDFPTAIRFANALMETGVEVHRTTRTWSPVGKYYPAGSLVVRCDQAFRAHVLDMFEPQDYPNDIPAPGAPPIPPYDSAGYTLAYQMGIQFDRILEPIDAPLELLEIQTLERKPWQENNGRLPMASNVNYEVVFEKLRNGSTASAHPDGTFTFDGTGTKLRMPRIALWDRYGGSMPSGWTRYIFDTVGIDYKVVYPQELDAGGLNAKYDVLVLPSGALGERLADNPPAERDNIPAQYRSWTGAITKQTLPSLRSFMEEGGTIVCVGGSVMLAQHLGLPVRNAVQGLPRTEFYIPGSVLQIAVDNNNPLAWGMRTTADVMFDDNPALKIEDEGVTPFASYTQSPLRSGWALGGEKLGGLVAAAEARIGKGRLVLYCPEITFRAQPHGTFKFLYNALLMRP